MAYLEQVLPPPSSRATASSWIIWPPVAGVRHAIEAVSCTSASPDFNPIQQVFAKLTSPCTYGGELVGGGGTSSLHRLAYGVCQFLPRRLSPRYTTLKIALVQCGRDYIR